MTDNSPIRILISCTGDIIRAWERLIRKKKISELKRFKGMIDLKIDVNGLKIQILSEAKKH